MAVYVDKLRQHTGVLWCHLTADNLAELQAFARRVNLPAHWFQAHPTHPHYDLTPYQRARAVAAGAVEVSAREQARRRREVEAE